MSEKMKLSPPWLTFYREVAALFNDDPEVSVSYDEETTTLKLYVDNAIKADAISTLLSSEKQFGNVTLNIEVIPSNNNETVESLFRHAFSGNPILSEIQTVEGVFTNPISYVVFEPSIVQFWNDNLGDLNGMCTMLPQDIARDVFGDAFGACFCTELLDAE